MRMKQGERRDIERECDRNRERVRMRKGKERIIMK